MTVEEERIAFLKNEADRLRRVAEVCIRWWITFFFRSDVSGHEPFM